QERWRHFSMNVEVRRAAHGGEEQRKDERVTVPRQRPFVGGRKAVPQPNAVAAETFDDHSGGDAVPATDGLLRPDGDSPTHLDNSMLGIVEGCCSVSRKHTATTRRVRRPTRDAGSRRRTYRQVLQSDGLPETVRLRFRWRLDVADPRQPS